MIASLLFYIVLAIASAGVTYAAQRKDDKRLLMVAIVMLTLVVGLRGPEVGEDTSRYIWVFDRCMKVGLSFIKRDQLYYCLGMALMFVFRTAYAPLIATAFFTFFFMIYRLWDFRRCGNLAIAVWVLVLFYMGYTMNGSRQLLCVAIVFYCSRYLEEKKFGKFILGVVLAALLHLSTVVVVVLPVFYIGLKKQYALYEKIYLAASAVGTVAMVILLSVVYSGYLESSGTMQIGAMTVVRLLLTIGTYGVWRFTEGHKSTELNKIFNLMFTLTLFGCLMSFANVILDSAGRMGYFFRFFETVMFAIVFKEKANCRLGKTLQAILLLVLSALGFYYLYRYNNIIPYQIVFF